MTNFYIKLAEIEKRFDKEYTVIVGTKKVRRVGYYCTPPHNQEDLNDPACCYADDIKSFYKSEITKLLDEAKKERCHDCNCLLGEKHYDGCDMEECPFCHLQLMSHSCSNLVAFTIKVPYGKEERFAEQRSKWKELSRYGKD